MIKNIWHDGPGLHVQHSQSDPGLSMNQQDAGRVRYNGDLACVETYNGHGWIQLQSTAMIGLNQDYISAIEWARGKMIEEYQIRELAAKHPAVADALLARDRAEDAVRIAVALCDIK